MSFRLHVGRCYVLSRRVLHPANFTIGIQLVYRFSAYSGVGLSFREFLGELLLSSSSLDTVSTCSQCASYPATQLLFTPNVSLFQGQRSFRLNVSCLSRATGHASYKSIAATLESWDAILCNLGMQSYDNTVTRGMILRDRRFRDSLR